MKNAKISAAVSIEDLRSLARKRLPRAIFDFLDGGAEDEWTLKQNRVQFGRWGLVPRFPVDVARRSLSTHLFGEEFGAPLVISPTGMIGLARARADVHLARAAAQRRIPFTLSTVATVSIEQVAAEAPGALWFQLYVLRDRKLTERLMQRASAAGYRALVVSVDCPVAGKRERDPRNGLTVPLRPTLRNVLDLLRRVDWLLELARNHAPRPENMVESAQGTTSGQALTAYMQSQLDPSVTWQDIDWVRSRWQGPLIIKGIAAPEDAVAAITHGADGVVVSNHGGRQLDGAVPSLEALRRVVDAVGGRTAVFCDSGFRRGADVVKALALGAQAVFLGRATVYGVAAGAEAGAAHALEILCDEIDRTLAFIGRRSIDEIDRSAVWDLSSNSTPIRADIHEHSETRHESTHEPDRHPRRDDLPVRSGG
jgi:isopentenyl diphosphate isomerase/L-lactate dehydrogenase-like FMN-dependent dehydrogenase